MVENYTWSEATFKVMEFLDRECGKENKWSTRQVLNLWINMTMVSYNKALYDADIQAIVDDTMGPPLCDNLHYKQVQKTLTNVLKANE